MTFRPPSQACPSLGAQVRASLRASARSGRRLRVFAVEKNPHAVVVLRRMVEREEGMKGTVEVVHADMRHWQAPEPADILVSELLGSFGDNELSPECLDGAQRFLRPDGISIPCSYTSYLHPVTAHKLWNDVRAFKEDKDWETPYVVKMHKVAPLAPVKEVFTFEHPNRCEAERGAPIDNRRQCRLAFRRDVAAGGATVHGLGGYFTSVLYPVRASSTIESGLLLTIELGESHSLVALIPPCCRG